MFEVRKCSEAKVALLELYGSSIRASGTPALVRCSVRILHVSMFPVFLKQSTWRPVR